MNILSQLIAEARSLANDDLCTSTGHDWISEGGRVCHKGFEDCSQTVYICQRCGQQDYGNKGGPAHKECKIECRREEYVD